MRRILVIDDEPKIVDFVSRALAGHGYEVDTALSGRAGLQLARSRTYELVVLDLLLPDINGIAVLRAMIEAKPDQLVLVLSALTDVDSKVRCLELGAIDYLPKPFAIAELVARIRTRLQVSKGASAEDRFLQAGPVLLELVRRSADTGSGPIRLSEREFLLLRHLMKKPGAVCSREEILGDVWGYSFDPGTNVVDVYIGRLRAKLGTDVIETVRNVGYSIAA